MLFSRLLSVVALLSVLFDASTAANFRATAANSAETVEIPADHARAQRALKYVLNAANVHLEKDQKEAKELVAKLHEEAKKLTKEDHAARAKSPNAKKMTQAEAEQVRWGSVVHRHRPNGDCSGVPTAITADRVMGECQSYGGGNSWYYTCSHEDEEGRVGMNMVNFNNDDCSGEPAYVFENQMSSAKCKMVYDSSSYSTGSIPSTKTIQCSRKSIQDYTVGGGIVSLLFEGDYTCSGSPVGVVRTPFNNCEMVTEFYDYQGNPSDYPTQSDYNRYHFVSITSCSPDTGKVTITGYSDRACTRPLYQGRGMIDQFQECHYDIRNGGYAFPVCAPAEGL